MKMGLQSLATLEPVQTDTCYTGMSEYRGPKFVMDWTITEQ